MVAGAFRRLVSHAPWRPLGRLAAGALLLGAASAQAQGPVYLDLIEYRQAAFKLIKWQLQGLNDMVKGREPFDAAEARRRAEALAALSELPWEGFAYPSSNGPTEAKASIWERKPAFEKKAAAFRDATEDLRTSAARGRRDELGRALHTTAKSCKACHDEFREEE